VPVEKIVEKIVEKRVEVKVPATPPNSSDKCVKRGMSKKQVIEKLGTPDGTAVDYHNYGKEQRLRFNYSCKLPHSFCEIVFDTKDKVWTIDQHFPEDVKCNY
jgi:hypothetical protein